MRLVIVHNHLRPGGVRRVIELAAPLLANRLRPRVKAVALATGEKPDRSWLRQFEGRLAPVPVECRVDNTLLYLAEQTGGTAELRGRMRSFLVRLLGPAGQPGDVVWAHNQGLGRNLLLARELERACARAGARLVLHHHDWWFDNRWDRWPEMRRHGFRTLATVARAVFPQGPGVRHVAINQRDAHLLDKQFGQRSGWVPNLAAESPPVPQEARARATRWLRRQLGESAPVWLMPCRLIRRKNIAEALLLTRWLRPEAWLVTTGGISSREEEAYAAQLDQAAARHGWRLRLAVLQGNSAGQLPVSDLMAASDAVLLTSLQEGFGLPCLEAPAAGRPLIARALPNVMPDLKCFGFRFPHLYEELLIDPALFNWRGEVERQDALYIRWRGQLPRPCRRLAGLPWLLRAAKPAPAPFSRLTLHAQLEVLRVPLAESWAACAPLNSFLEPWRALASRGALAVTRWPERARYGLSGAAYARRFRRVLAGKSSETVAGQGSLRLQHEFMRQTLSSANLYPLSWSALP